MTLLLLASPALAYGQSLVNNPYGGVKRQVGSDSVVAVVEDRVITRNELIKEVEPFIPQIRAKARSEYEFNQNVNNLMNELVQRLVDKQLIIKEFHERQMVIPQAALDNYFEDYLQREFNGDRAEFLKYVQSQGKTVKQFRAELEDDLIVMNMQQHKRLTVTQISPTKIIEYYEANKNKWYMPASAKVNQIILKVGRNKTLESQKALAADIVKKARAGEDFATLAEKYSDDTSADKGGDCGVIKKGDFTPQLDEAVFKLKAGEVSDPIDVSGMIFIFKVSETKPEGIQPIDDVRDQIEWLLVDQNQRLANQKWIEGLRKKAYIKYYQ